MFIFSVALAENEGIMEENDLSINILHHDQEGFGTAMDLLIPAEVRDNRKINTQQGAGDRLNLGLKPGDNIRTSANDKKGIYVLKLREAVNESVDKFSRVWYPDELTNFRRRLQDTNEEPETKKE